MSDREKTEQVSDSDALIDYILTGKGDVKALRRKVKDSVFASLFCDERFSRRFVKEIAGDLDPSIDTDGEIRSIGLSNVLADGRTNDVAIMIDGMLIFALEAQSTWSPNMPVRIFVYLGIIYNRYLALTGKAGYSGSLLRIPAPAAYVVYTGGRRDVPDSLRLSDAFMCESPTGTMLELTVRVVHGPGSADTALGQYIRFCEIVDECRRMHPDDEGAVTAEVRMRCTEEGILGEYLEDKWWEAFMFEFFNQEGANEWIRWDQGKKIAKRLLLEGDSPEKISRCTDLTLDEVLEIQREIENEASEQPGNCSVT